MQLIRVGALCQLIAAVTFGALWLSGILTRSQALQGWATAFGVIGLFFLAAYIWRLVRGNVNQPDHTDQPVP